MGDENMLEEGLKLPEIIVFAGPNGSGKSTITKMVNTAGKYINADDIKRSTHCSDLEAAVKAEALREEALANKESFTFETVLSTPRNLDLLRRAHEQGFFVRGFFVLTRSADVNVFRVLMRAQAGGHDVPKDKIRSRFNRSLAQLPQFIDACDICHIYDNTEELYRIYKKRKERGTSFPSVNWPPEKISMRVNEGILL